MKRVLFIGQAMPRVNRDIYDWPTLNAWLYSIGLTHEQIVENFLYSALVNYFPGVSKGSHLVPTRQQIFKDRDRLRKVIVSFEPELIVTIGKLSISYCFQDKNSTLSQYVGNSFELDPYELWGRKVQIIPLPHPSGASVWYKKEENKVLLEKALKLLKENII